MRQVNGKEIITGRVQERRILTSHSTDWTYCDTGTQDFKLRELGQEVHDFCSICLR